ncbi:MAG: gamma-glutamyl-gamma-aminobutyrate hydrolase family protein [Rhodocyclaceae bacterium]
MTTASLRIGISMREANASGYDEPRDALARNWGVFLATVLPDAAWLPVPNLGAAGVQKFCEQWQLNALILSGGEDVGTSPLRDETERALLALATRHQWPVLGVCRGLQLMWLEYGGTLGKRDGHAGARHGMQGSPRELNSFHHNTLDESGWQAPATLRVFARAQDGSAEGVAFGQPCRWLGVMWHPEREATAHPDDMDMLQGLFASKN